MSRAVRSRAFVDALEGEHARLLLEERTFTVPVSLLPVGIKEGDWVTITVAPDLDPNPDLDSELRRRLTRDDDGGDFSLSD